MAKIDRFDGDVQAFAINNQSGEKFLFGSSSTDSNNLTDQLTPEFLRGWATVGASEFPPLEWFNAAMFTSTQFIAYLHQMGVAEWNPSQEYPTQGALVVHNGNVWKRASSWSPGDEPGASSSWVNLLDSDSVGEFVYTENRLKGNQNWNVEGQTGDPIPSSTPTLYAVGSEIAAGRFCIGSDLVNCTRDGGLFDADSGSYYIDYEGDFSNGFFGIKLDDDSIVQTGCSLSLTGGNTRLTVDMSIAPAHKFAGLSESPGVWPDLNDNNSSSSLYADRITKRAYSDVTGSRSIGVTYTNLSGCDIVVNVRFDSLATGQNMRFEIDGIETSRQRADDWANTKYYTIESQVVPHGSTYMVTEGGPNYNWIELRA